MIDRIKIGILAIIVSFSFLGFNFTVSANANSVPTPEQFEEYLMEKGDHESLQLKDHFSKLPLTKKKKYLQYTFNPEIVKNIYSQDLPSDGKKEFYGGDVVIENKTTITEKDIKESVTPVSLLSSFLFSNVFAAPTIKEYTAAHSKRINMVGTWVQFNTSIKYRVTNGKVSKIFSGNSTVTRHMWFAVLERKSFEKYITKSNNMAHGSATWDMSLPLFKTSLIDISPMSCNCIHQVHGYSNGKVTHGYWEE